MDDEPSWSGTFGLSIPIKLRASILAGEMMRGIETVRVLAIASILVSSGLLAIAAFSPGGERSVPPASDLPASGKSTVLGKTLVVAMGQEVSPLDPTKTSSMFGPASMIYETLISRNPAGDYLPGLASEWNMNRTDPANPTFDIELKQGVKFHDGLAFDTLAVKRIIDYSARNESWMQYQFWSVYGCMNKTGWPDMGIWCKDQYNMSLNLTYSDASLVFNLSNLYASMMSPDATDTEGAFYGLPGHKAVGTGPFELKEWVAGDHVTLVKNPNYTWGPSWYINKGPAVIDQVIYEIIPDSATRLALFENGSLDVLIDVPPNKIANYGSSPFVDLITGPGQGTYHIDFNCQKDPWDNATLRKAFAYAVNRTEIRDVVWEGLGGDGVNYLPPICEESRDISETYNFSYDPSNAESLFSAAGFTDTDSDGWLENASSGNELNLPIWTMNDGTSLLMAEMVQQYFQAAGVHAPLTQYSGEQLRTMASNGEHDAVLYSNSWPRADVLDWEFGTWAMGGSNIAWFSDPVFDAYVTNFTLADSDASWSENATLAHMRLLDLAPRIPLIYWPQIIATQANVTGWYVHNYGGEMPFDINDVDVDHAPIAVLLASPNPAPEGVEITFDASDSMDDVGIENWTWTFSDGGNPVTLWGEVAAYTPAGGPQDLSVTLTVQDTSGRTDGASTVVTVTTVVPEFPGIMAGACAITVIALAAAGRRKRQDSQ